MRASPPVVIVWRPWLQILSPPTPCVRSRFDADCALDNPAMPLENASAGGPQFDRILVVAADAGVAETFVRLAKYGVTSVVSRVYW